MTLLEQSDCHLPESVKPHIFSYFHYYFGVILDVNDKVFKLGSGFLESRSKRDIFLSSSVIPLIREYELEGMELIESFGKLSQYIEEKHPLASAALEKKKEVYRLSEHLPLNKSL